MEVRKILQGPGHRVTLGVRVHKTLDNIFEMTPKKKYVEIFRKETVSNG